jgi:hypothetical protein
MPSYRAAQRQKNMNRESTYRMLQTQASQPPLHVAAKSSGFLKTKMPWRAPTLTWSGTGFR